MNAANRDRHAADSNRKRITAERPEVERLDRNAGIESEMTQAIGLAGGKRQLHQPGYRRGLHPSKLGGRCRRGIWSI